MTQVRNTVSGVLCLLTLLTGRTDDTAKPELSMPVFPAIQSGNDQQETVIREVNQNELQPMIETCQRPVLVGSSLLFGCSRCDDMRSPIRKKAETEGPHQAAEDPDDQPEESGAVVPFSLVCDLSGCVCGPAEHRCCSVAHTNCLHRPGPYRSH